MPIGFIGTTDAKYDQTARLLRQGYDADAPIINADEMIVNPETGEYGSFEMVQHPVTGELMRKWNPANEEAPNDPEFPEGIRPYMFKCQARSIITGGLNSQGTTQRWTTAGLYENVDYIELQVPRNVVITKRDRITDITNSRGEIVWREEEHGDFRPTVFSVRGVAPSLDPFGSLMEWFILLERSEIQSGNEGIDEHPTDTFDDGAVDNQTDAGVIPYSGP